MRVVVPATQTGLHPSVLPAIVGQEWRAEVWPMTAQESYWRLLVDLWARGETFAIVEHDVETSPGVLDAFDRCAEVWCAHSYDVYVGDLATAYGGPFGLGCVRFRAELLARWPEAVVEAGQRDEHPLHPPRSYAVMDSTLTHVLRAAGVVVHQHYPNVTHHHAYMRTGAFPAPANLTDGPVSRDSAGERA